jgi:tetratricopeptide (TPR) repeat protein
MKIINGARGRGNLWDLDLEKLGGPILLGCLLLLSGCARDTTWTKASDAGRQAFELGNYSEAAEHYEVALQEANRFGARDPRLVTTLQNLGLVYEMMGRYPDAESLYQRVWDIRRENLGEKNQSVAFSVEKLADIYQAEKKYADAEKLYSQSLDISRQNLGPQHLEIARILEKHAQSLRRLHRDDDAAQDEALVEAIHQAHEK